MYQINLDKDRMQVHVAGLDAAVRLIAQQISNNNSSGAALKQLLPQLIKLDREFDLLQEVVAGQDELDKIVNVSSQQVQRDMAEKVVNGAAQ